MRKRPFELTFLSIGLFVLAASMPLQILLLTGKPLAQIYEIFANFAPLNWTVMVLAIASGVLILRAECASSRMPSPPV